MGFFDKLKKITSNLFSGFTEADEDFFEELEETLIMADLGVDAATDAVEKLRTKVRKEHLQSQEAVREGLREILMAEMEVGDTAMKLDTKPSVCIFIGVNGVGKTTSIGKIAHDYAERGRRPMLAAADTFRAAAAEQLGDWAQRAGVPMVRHQEGSDPAAVVYDAIASYKAKGCDLLIVDTAGRLHNKKNLMNELAKIRKVIARELPELPCEVLLVLDGTTGQNAVAQAQAFQEACALTGVVLTKLDGTAKGGVVVNIVDTLHVPVRFIGVGEGIDDLKRFSAEEFARALL